MKRTLYPVAAIAALCALLAGPDTARCTANLDQFFHPGQVRVLIFSGRNNHDWRSTTPRLKRLLVESGRFDVRVEEEPNGATAATLAPYDLLVLDYSGPRWDPATEKAVEDFVRSGKGLVAVHGANYAFGEMEALADRHVRTGIFEPPWPEYKKLVGGVWSVKEPKSAHGARHSFQVRFTDREHPVARGMAGTFWATDELYHNPHMDPGAKVIAVAFSDTSTGGTGKDEPILWTVQYGAGRVFYTALGHDLIAMAEPGFNATFLRGCEWAATGKVTLPPEFDPDKVRADALRVLTVTGGHDFDT
jgi:uncharacterized protein